MFLYGDVIRRTGHCPQEFGVKVYDTAIDKFILDSYQNNFIVDLKIELKKIVPVILEELLYSVHKFGIEYWIKKRFLNIATEVTVMFQL